MGLDDVVSNKQAKTDPFVFGGEKGVENASSRLFTHAHTGVRKGSQDVVAFFSYGDGDDALLDDGLHRIADEIHKRQLDEVRIEQRDLVAGTVEVEVNFLAADRNAHEIERLFDHPGEHGFTQDYGLRSRIGEQVVDDPVDGVDAENDRIGEFPLLIPHFPLKDHGQIKLHASQRILYLMGNPRCHLPHGSQPLVPFKALLHLLDFGNVLENDNLFPLGAIGEVAFVPPEVSLGASDLPYSCGILVKRGCKLGQARFLGFSVGEERRFVITDDNSDGQGVEDVVEVFS